jgi:CO/xanthine dehydrogenase Mo-binding subunit
MDKAVEMIGYEKFIKEEQPKLRAQGKHVGIGVVSYIEGTGIGPYEGARVNVEASGKVSVCTGVGTQGQGHFTSFAQVVAEVLDVDVRNIRVVTGDTGEFHWGIGTFASRGAVVAASACHQAAILVCDKIFKLAAEILKVSREELELSNGKVQVKGKPDTAITLGELAVRANPLRGAVKAGTEPGLEATSYFGPERGAQANGVHAMILEVNLDTMMVEIKRYVVVHDCGKMINPLIVEAQIQGGVAQGIGNSFYEQLVFDKNGQLLNASFMDYLLPTAMDVPKIDVGHVETPSPLNPLGTKGVGEGGAIPTTPLFAQALEDALHDRKIEIRDMPLSPKRLFEIVQEAPKKG